VIQVNILGPHVELEEVGICQSVVVQLFGHDNIVKEKRTFVWCLMVSGWIMSLESQLYLPK